MSLEEQTKQAQSVEVFGASGVADKVLEWLSTSLPESAKLTVYLENDDFLFRRALIVDSASSPNRRSFEYLKHERNRLVERLKRALPEHSSVDVFQFHLDFPTRMIRVDKEIYEIPWFIEVGEGIDLSQISISLSSEAEWFLDALKLGSTLAKYTTKVDVRGRVDVETIEAFDEDRVRRGIFPRSTFYDSDLIKLVVWVYIFDRNGRVLIHKRSRNAKDNRDMWDKSVGGHTDYLSDSDSTKTVAREVIEELFTNELKDERFLMVNSEDIVFLGDWIPEKRFDAPFAEIVQNPKSWFYFRDPDSYRAQSNRHLVDGSILRNEVIADVYYMVLSKDISDETLESFENSDFRFVSPTDLKQLHDESNRGSDMKFTPDLTFAMTGRIRHKLEEIQNYIQYNMS